MHNALQDDLPLTFWEKGPVRDAVDTEFEVALIEESHARGIQVDEAMEKRLRDAIVPNALLTLMAGDLAGVNIATGEIEEHGRAELRAGMTERIREALPSGAQHAELEHRSVFQPLLLPTKKRPSHRPFFHP